MDTKGSPVTSRTASTNPPNFDQIADRIVGRIDVRARGGGNGAAETGWVAEHLRQVWNARGAADDSLFRKYIAFIVRHEGTNYLDYIDAEECFTHAELTELLRIANEPANETKA